VVAYEHGENSARTLNSAGFQNLMFRSYNGYSIYFFFIHTKSKGDNICVWHEISLIYYRCAG